MDSSGLAEKVWDCLDKDEANLASLDITSEEFTDFVMPAFKMAKWSRIILCENSIDDTALREFTETLASGNTELVELDLGWNQITDDGLIELSRALQYSAIREIILHSNEISDRGIVVLAQVLGKTSLHTLDLCGNAVTDQGAEALAQSIVHYPALQSLDLSENRITDTGARKLVEAMRRSCLEFLILNNNPNISQGMLEVVEQTELLVRHEFRIMVTLCSARMVPRLSGRCRLKTLPIELLQRVANVLYIVQDLDGIIPST